MGLPAAALLGALALRMLQPPPHEPARPRWRLTDGAASHVSPQGAAVLFVALPGTVVVTGAATLMRAWREAPALRQDAAAPPALVRRRAILGLVFAATLLGGAILGATLVHIVAD